VVLITSGVNEKTGGATDRSDPQGRLTSFMNNVPDPLLSGDDLPTFKCNAKGGTPLMQSVQTIGIDLPLKALVWQDASGNTWLSYNDPRWLAKRHGLGDEGDQALDAMATALDAIAKAATSSCS